MTPEPQGANTPVTKGELREALSALAALITRELAHVHGKIDRGFDDLQSEMGEGFTGVDRRVDGLEHQMERGLADSKDSIRELTGEVRQVRQNHEERIRRLEYQSQ